MLQLLVDSLHVEPQLPDVLRLHFAGLQLDNDKTPQFQMVEQKVDEILVAVNLYPELAADERKAAAELQQKPRNIVDKRIFELPFGIPLAEREEVKAIWIL